MRRFHHTITLTWLFLLPLSSGLAADVETYEQLLGKNTYVLQEIFYDGFSDNLANWRAEGNALVRVNERGWLEVEASARRGVAATIWCRNEFEGPQVVEYDVQLIAGSLFSNVNMFLLASMLEGPGILETGHLRTGDYGEYHVFPNYLITLLNGTSPAEKREMLRVRIRLNPDFNLVGETWCEPFVFGRIYHVAYVLQPPKVGVYLDGRLLKEEVYDVILNKGMHGLRIWSTHSIYDNFRVSRIIGPKGN